MINLVVFNNNGGSLGTGSFQDTPAVGDTVVIKDTLYRVVARRWLLKSGDLEIIVVPVLKEIG